MMLTDQQFQQESSDSLERLYRRLGSASEDYDFDVEMNGGALTVEFEDPPERFVVSPNSPVKQIWVSAHVQSFKLDWAPEAGSFVLAATGQTLDELMEAAIQKRLQNFAL